MKKESQIEFTLDVPEAGRRYFGLGVCASYRAAKSGQIPTVKIGKRLKVPIVQVEALLRGEKP